jgi:NTP pyrophosphatase (non-canonical NTP hydrolase)
MTTLTREDLLVLLIEECGEVIQAATKCLRFGYESDHGIGYGRNDAVLSREIGQCIAIMNALPTDQEQVHLGATEKIKKAEAAKAQYGQRAAVFS